MTDPNPNDDLKQKEARAKAEAAVARAQADLLKAQAELTAAAKPPDAPKPPDAAVVASTAEKARLDALKGVLESSKALSDAKKSADLAAAQAAIGTVVGSSVEGAVSLKSDAGKGEATLLASQAIASAAAHVAEDIRAKVKDRRVVLMQGAEAPQFANYRQFLLQEALIARVLDEARKEADRLADEGQRLVDRGKPAVAAQTEAIPALTTAGVVIDAVAKLGSYFMSNYDIGGIALTSDTEQIVGATANRLLRSEVGATAVVLPGRRVPRPEEFKDTIASLAARVIEADSKLNDYSAEARRVKDLSDGETDNLKKQSLLKASTFYDQATAILRKAITKAEELIAGLAVADAKGVLLVTKIAQEKAICDELNKHNSLALVLDVRATIGGYYTKKNLWTFLGSMPFYAMGGVVVTYYLMDQDGVLKGAGLVPIHSGYAPVSTVQKMITRGSP
jgi:hypothetical protein